MQNERVTVKNNSCERKYFLMVENNDNHSTIYKFD